jgi:hypothetical protein
MTAIHSDVATAADLSADIQAIVLASTGTGVTYSVTLTDALLNISTAIAAINIKNGDTLTINGDEATRRRGPKSRLFVYSGNVTIENLSIMNGAAEGGPGATASTPDWASACSRPQAPMLCKSARGPNGIQVK